MFFLLQVLALLAIASVLLWELVDAMTGLIPYADPLNLCSFITLRSMALQIEKNRRRLVVDFKIVK